MLTARRPLALLLAVPTLVAGCSATPPTTALASTPPAISANPTPVSTAATTPATTETASTPATAGCPAGDYKATGFTATGLDASVGKGTVTDVDVTFGNGRYEFDFDGDHPAKLTLGKNTGQLRIDGEFTGTYSGQPDAISFTRGKATGSARFVDKGRSRSVTMQQVARILAPQGKGSAVCDGDKLTIKVGTLSWNLVRDPD